MKKALFISSNQIGFRAQKERQNTTSWIVQVESEACSPFDLLDEIKRRLSSFSLVVVYAPERSDYIGLIQLAATDPDKLRLVLCRCNEQEKCQAMRRSGMAEHMVYWDDCGGQARMGELLSYFVEQEELPVPITN